MKYLAIIWQRIKAAPRIKTVAYSASVLFFAVVLLGIGGSVVKFKQFAYQLSQMEPAEARALALDVYEREYREIARDAGFTFTSDDIYREVDRQMADAKAITSFDRAMAATTKSRGFRLAEWMATIGAIIALICLGLKQAEAQSS